ncbi:DUF5337 domain-containing protein [Roseovarius sp. EL26]|uniref:DUF5337 domain-containing protein n=1 Tax=Roseovarius sp. EL26 TaxID=2126672 RepID=UPI0013C44480|nr:DUF5337 domain-containing protein [Roseovarius sp. EL26]
MTSDKTEAQKGRHVALVIAGTAVFWVLASLIGGVLGISHRMLALFDLVALAGFIWAFWMIFQIWRARQDKQG